MDREASDREHRLIVKHRDERRARVVGPEHPAGGRADPDPGGVERVDVERRHATADVDGACLKPHPGCVGGALAARCLESP